ncbi:MAG: nitroreductase family protein [Gammaproteobacteria bacterium]|nr:nitroreductase family protein [Gammaproteobacteria bacterium]
MWDFFETVRNRHSTRKYQSDMPIEQEKIHAILEMACAAPSAGDIQPYRIFVVSNAAKRKALSDAADQQAFIAEAPVCLVFCAVPAESSEKFGERGETLYALQDTTIAAAYAQLAVVAAGLASTWVGSFDEDKVRAQLGLEESLVPVAMLSLGYPAEIPAHTHRAPLSKIVTYTE